jgi:hypothetical protein
MPYYLTVVEGNLLYENIAGIEHNVLIFAPVEEKLMSFWYLGSPYSEYRDRSIAHMEACRAAAKLIEARIPVYSPIAHSHLIAEYSSLDPFDPSIWMRADEPMMRCAHGLVVLMLPHWQDSKGLAEEIAYFQKAGKPVVYMTPHHIPLVPLSEIKL